ncbi:methyl-accepting chemotaxis protein [Sphingomonas sp. A2-49]|uniref:methyl-accepting chemotaxis protein n=1 Tax=Sphingomonas sp. A2-49 TaxID=1391375 RepID=UPI0021D04E7F|nr:methyl-accepting chemotaxis protein [Sphingomonas sp. A2-49]MCU6454306.1 methyl-accepting chemotaxis protein [Sphingomonas sp. A2-49]
MCKMLNWFEKRAPIRSKFRALGTVQGILGTIPVAITAASTSGLMHTSAGFDIGLSAVTVAALVGTTMFAGRVICKPYVETVVRMEALAAGDLEGPIAHTENLDCVGRMTKAMAIFRRNMEEANTAEAQRQMASALAEGLGELARGNLTFRIAAAFPADFETLRSDFNRAMDAIMEAVTAVNRAAVGINAGSSDILQASDDLSQRTEQQAASLEETAAAMDEITSTVRQTAAGANRANGVVAEARGEAEQSGEVVARAVDAMSGIERASNEISEIISVIDGIAFQTNLLALNAGVEAARAGDAGRGFAVVASEVRALAQRSAEAAKDVKTRITASSEQVDAGVELVSKTGAALQRIIGRFGEISGLVEQIARAAEHQATGLQQVNTAVGEMDGVTQQNAAMVEEATAAARTLSAEADELARQVARFRIEDDVCGPAAAPAAPGHAPANAVRQLQQRAATAGRRIAAAGARRGGAAAAVATDDWAEF